MRHAPEFSGPIFIVGMPRSGTNLLRGILNNHPQIAIATKESGCIPYYYHRFERFGNIEDRRSFQRFFDDFSKTVFFERLTAIEPFIDADSWYDSVETWTFSGVIEAFYRQYARYHGKSIWGDKTPQYVYDMPLLKSIFPSARFIHIVRDPRDCALSNRRAWSKNIYRTVQKWVDAVEAASAAANESPRSYLTIRYEDLVSSPAKVVARICEFVDVSYCDDLTTLRSSADSFGSSQGRLDIKEDNTDKWVHALDGDTVEKLDRICGSLLDGFGYQSTYKGPPIRISRSKLRFYKTLDALNMVVWYARRNSLSGISTVYRMNRRKRLS